jgi:hypothetical protein
MPSFDVKLSEYEIIREQMDTPRVSRSKTKHMIITENDEAVVRHTMAQDLV